jgi:hypothetical protein
MGDINTVTPEAGTEAGSQTATPPIVPTPKPDPVDELRRKTEALEKQVADKEKYINDLKSEKDTLEARLTETQPRPQSQPLDTDLQREAASILETAQVDPAKAGEALANLIKTTSDKAQQAVLGNLAPIIEQNTYVAKIKSENADLMELGLEPAITVRANQLIRSGKQFKEAVDMAVRESRIKVDKLKSNTPPPPIVPPPDGAVGESGNNRQPEPPVIPKDVTPEDELKAERERRRKSGL